MKIGIYDPYLDTLGGGEKYMLTIAECYAQNHKVTIFWNDEKIRKKAEDKFGLSLKNIQFTPNLFVKKLSLLERYKETSKYDLIIYLSDGSIPLLFSKKVFLHFQYPVEWVKTGYGTTIKLKRINKVICNSLYTKKFIDKKFGIKSQIIYPPVDTKAFITTEKKENLILTVGRYSSLSNGSDFKKLTTLIETFKKMVDKGLSGWRFIVVTSFLPQETKNVERLKESIKKYPVTLYENVNQEELAQHYRNSKIYWHASGFGEDLKVFPERAEHFGISTVEAMSAGCVPVVINAGGQKETVLDGKNGFVWETIGELIKKTDILVRDNVTYYKFSKACTDSAKQFDKERFCSLWYELIS
jgi:glycosyltransferase involved in cell wall biosynthesis